MGERQFGPYRLVRQIAVGGMAEIHLAKTKGLAGFEKYVALKMIHPNFSQDEQFVQMLIDEAKITVQLQHVNVAQTFDLGRVGETYYITMEYVDGADLYKLLRRGSEQDLDLPVEVCAYVAKEMATGLDYAHRKRDMTGRPLGIVHRDVSPQNVLISHAGEVKLVDFGIAKATMRVRQTAVGVIKGKYYYMSPEQAWGETVDHRSDIFSAGIVLYEMLTGQMLYLEEDLHKLLDMVRRANIALPSTLRKGIPPQLERIVMHALAKNVGDRYQSAADLATDLERFLHGYAPVFTAAKVAQHYRRILGEPVPMGQAPAVPAPAVAAPRDPNLSTQPLAPAQLARARSEFTDENSVIFRINELAGREREGRGGDLDETTAEEGPRRSRKLARDDAGPRGEREAEERTLVSGPPGERAEPARGGGPRGPTVALGGGADGFEEDSDADPDADYEPTFVDPMPRLSGGSDEEGPTWTRGLAAEGLEAQARAARAAGQSALPDDDSPVPVRDEESVDLEGPTKDRFQLGALPAPPPKPGPPPTPGRPRPESKGPPAHPALSARSPTAAVSELRKPRQSRRTPVGGVPRAGEGRAEAAPPERPSAPGGSVLQSLVSGAVTEPLPTRPVRGTGTLSDGIPRGVLADPLLGGQPGLPGMPGLPGAPPVPFAGHGGAGGPGVPSPLAPESSADLSLPAYQPLPPGAVQLPLPPVQSVAAPAPPHAWFSNPPQSFSDQVAALQVDEIPAAYKLSRGAPSPWLVRGVLAVVCIAVGVAIGVLWLERDSPPLAAPLVIDSIPQGAIVRVDGLALQQPTPTRYDASLPGQTYRIELALASYQKWSKSVVARNDGGEVSVLGVLAREPVRLRVVTTPPGADVFINGEFKGRSPLELLDLNSEATKSVELRLRGYVAETRALDWSKGSALELDLQLKP